MIAIVCDARDAGARELAERWREHGARRLLARDLCAPGWVFSPGAADGSAVLDGQRVATAELRGVLVRIGAVQPSSLPHIVAADRAYVAAELTAFLTAWLDALPCRVVNRPSGASLLGPPCSPARWRAIAVRAGIPVASEAPAKFVTVVGERAIGDDAGDAPVRLAKAAGVELMAARFTADDALVGADLFVDIGPEVADALLEVLR